MLATIPEIFDPGTGAWTKLEDAERRMQSYPFMFVLPNEITIDSVTFPAGSVFYAGPDKYDETDPRHPAVLDWDAEVWSSDILLPQGQGQNSLGGSAVMYRPGKVIRCGGDDEATDTVWVIDMTVDDPEWGAGPAMVYARRNHNLVMLPDGTVLCVGGNVQGADGRNVPDTGYPEPVLACEILDPTAGSPEWVEHEPMTVPRWYHSTALLLPDARVLVAGGNYYYASMQIFSPPYLDGSPSRCQIFSAPSTISYGTDFSISVVLPDGRSIAKIALIRLAAVTHGFDQDQRYVPLEFSGTTVTPPADADIAPPGYYMLWVVDDNGVPCRQAKYVKLR